MRKSIHLAFAVSGVLAIAACASSSSSGGGSASGPVGFVQISAYTGVATVFGTDTGSQGDLPGVVHGVNTAGIRRADQENLTPDQPSYRSAAQRLLAAKPQAIITESDGPTAATFFGELKQLGSLVPIIGTSGTPSTSYFSPLRGAIGSANFDKYFRAVVVGNPVANPAVTAFNKAVLAVQGKLAKPVTQWENNSFSESG